MTTAEHIRRINQIEASVQIMQAHLLKILADCRSAKREMEGVSTPSLPDRGVDADRLIAKREANIYKRRLS